MESLREKLDRFKAEGNMEGIDTLDEEVGYVIDFSKRKVATTLAEHDRMQKNLEMAEANQRLIRSYK